MQKGTKHSDETRARIALSKTGQKPSADTCSAISNSLKGKSKSPQHRENIKIAALARYARLRAEQSNHAPN